MQPDAQSPVLDDWEPFIGTWTTEATHPMLPGDAIRGEASFEWLDGRRFVVQRTSNDHPRVPDAISVIGVVDGALSMHYYDSRGVARVYEVSLIGDTWRFWRDVPGFAQRVTGIFRDGGNVIESRGELCRDGSTWEDDLSATYRRVR
jgi:hypothetical protein